MTNLTKYLIGAGAGLLILLFVFMGGCSVGKHRIICPEVKTDTITRIDTVEYRIKDTIRLYYEVPGKILYVDVPVLPTKEDTARILKDFYAKHPYFRSWNDKNVEIYLNDTLTQNNFLHNDFSYKILRPQEIINNVVDNSIHYNKYIDLNGTYFLADYKYTDFWLSYHWSRASLGGGYAPFIKSVTLHGGITLFKFK